MRNKTTIIFLLIIFSGICAYNLYWTFVQFNMDREVKNLQTAVLRNPGDTLAQRAYQARLDDASFQKKYRSATDNSFTLGLDLQGGMFVSLEVGVEDVIRQLAGNNANDSSFKKAIDCATKRQETAQEGFVSLFVSCFKEISPNKSLGAIFASPERQISINTSESDVVEMLNKESGSAINRTFNIVRTRIDQFGVVSPNLQLQENTGRIILELPGVKDPERVRKILRSTAKLEFWTTHNTLDAYRVLYQINEKLKALKGITSEPDSSVTDSSANPVVSMQDSSVQALASADSAGADTGFTSFTQEDGGSQTEGTSDSDKELETFKRNNPLLAVLRLPDGSQIQPTSTYPAIGQATALDTAKVNEYLRMPEIEVMIPDDMKFAWSFKSSSETEDIFDLVALKTRVLGGDKVSNANPDFDERGRPQVAMQMNVEGTRDWARITESNVNRHVAIILDNYVYSFPVVEGRIPYGQSVINGTFDVEEAQDLANVLKAGQLPVPARIESEDVIGPTLGEENISKGLLSFIIALIVTLIFMAFYYARAGLVANVALISNLTFLLGCSAAFTIVLTMSGIAAVVLTIGMAVDANVLIFERIREEIAKGKTQKAAIKAGFSNAFSSIMDSNITTFLTGVILYAFGIGPIRGFAVSLMIGIVTSLIAALIITRLILEYYANKGKDLTFGYSFSSHLFDKLKVGMIQKRRTYYLVSAALVGLSIVSFLILGFKTGVDLKGGRQYVIEFTQKDASKSPYNLTGADLNEMRNSLSQSFEGEAPLIKTMSSDNQIMVTTSYKVGDREAGDDVNRRLMSGLEQRFGQLEKTILSSNDVGPTVASDIRRAAYLAIIFSLLVIFLYILLRFQKWEYSLGAVAALFHDVIITLGVFSLLGQFNLPFNLEIDQALVAALLTIVGYSINDTVVVFDRIREELLENKTHTLDQIFDDAIDKTLSRTLITSGTTLLTGVVLFFLGGDVIKGFVFAILIGITIGTYSSIFVASPIALDLLKRKVRKEQALQPA